MYSSQDCEETAEYIYGQQHAPAEAQVDQSLPPGPTARLWGPELETVQQHAGCYAG